MSKTISILTALFLLGFSADALVLHSQIIYNRSGDIQVRDPGTSQAFYDQLGGQPRNYSIESLADFDLYLNLLVPQSSNFKGRYSVNVYRLSDNGQELVSFIDGNSQEWEEFYEPLSRDYYLRGPEFEKSVSSGNYKIEVFSQDNRGKYVLAIGKKKEFSFSNILSAYWTLPTLKIEFFKTSLLEFLLTPFAIIPIIGLLIIVVVLLILNYIFGLIKKMLFERKIKAILLTSAGMKGVGKILIEMLQKPAYNLSVAHIITASKPEEDTLYMKQDKELMREAGFNVEDIDIEGKTKNQLMKLLNFRDVIYVQGGNTFYLLKCIRQSGFDKVVKKLLKRGVIYIGVSAGSIAAGRTIETANWKNGDKNIVNLKNLKGLELVPFNIFVHYKPEHAEIIKAKPKRVKKRLRILTDQQAILIQGRKTYLVGEGQQINPLKL